jgi:hypothetical protein
VQPRKAPAPPSDPAPEDDPEDEPEEPPDEDPPDEDPDPDPDELPVDPDDEPELDPDDEPDDDPEDEPDEEPDDDPDPEPAPPEPSSPPSGSFPELLPASFAQPPNARAAVSTGTPSNHRPTMRASAFERSLLSTKRASGGAVEIQAPCPAQRRNSRDPCVRSGTAGPSPKHPPVTR